MTVDVIGVNNTYFQVQETSFRCIELFYVVHSPAESGLRKMDCAHEGMDTVTN